LGKKWFTGLFKLLFGRGPGARLGGMAGQTVLGGGQLESGMGEREELEPISVH